MATAPMLSPQFTPHCVEELHHTPPTLRAEIVGRLFRSGLSDFDPFYFILFDQ